MTISAKTWIVYTSMPAYWKKTKFKNYCEITYACYRKIYRASNQWKKLQTNKIVHCHTHLARQFENHCFVPVAQRVKPASCAFFYTSKQNCYPIFGKTVSLHKNAWLLLCTRDYLICMPITGEHFKPNPTNSNQIYRWQWKFL